MAIRSGAAEANMDQQPEPAQTTIASSGDALQTFRRSISRTLAHWTRIRVGVRILR